MTELAAQAMVCGWCDFHLPLEAGPHLDLLVDKDSFRPLDSSVGPARLGWATLAGRPLAVAVSDPASRWDAAEIGALAALAEEAAREHRPLLWVVTALQGVAAPLHWPGLQIALDRMGEVSTESGRSTPAPWIALLSGPVYGPAAALASQADLVLAEPGTVLAPVLPQVLRQAGRLPLESTRPPRQLLRAGWADAVFPRSTQRAALADLLGLLGVAGEGATVPPASATLERLPEPFRGLFTAFHELSGDRQAADDPALMGGLARLKPDGLPLLVLATAYGEGRKARRRAVEVRGVDQGGSWAGRPTHWRQPGLQRRAGAIGAAGWRKATRLLRLAGRFGLPVVLLVDRPTLRTGRRDGPGEATVALGETVRALTNLPVPIVAVHMGVDTGLATLILSLADSLLAKEDLAPQLHNAGIPVSGTWGESDLAAQLARVLGELKQSYLLHGPLGRRALAQHRYVRWARIR
jgi:acetyl-CoA carboxylase beta subunit